MQGLHNRTGLAGTEIASRGSHDQIIGYVTNGSPRLRLITGEKWANSGESVRKQANRTGESEWGNGRGRTSPFKT